MALPQEVQQSFNSLVNSGSIRRVVIPAGAPIAIVSDGAAAANVYAAWVQIVAAAVITDPTWLAGVTILQSTLAAADLADLNIGSGALAAEVSLAEFAYFLELAAGAGIIRPVVTYEMAYPIRVAGAPRIAARIRKASAASATGVTPKAIFYTAFGT